MATIKEDYVSFETAKLLKEKGFKTPVETGYYGDGRICHNIALDFMDYNHEDGYYSRPTLQMAMKWLREVHDIDVSVVPLRSHKEYLPRIESDPISHDAIPCKKYEKACEIAIKYCLKNLI